MLKSVHLVPGLPHILFPSDDSHRKLCGAMKDVAGELSSTGVERILYYSTQWISVLGTSFQGRGELKGLHVDENWYERGDLPFSFAVDREFSKQAVAAAQAQGFATQLVDFADFPIDTGTIVADTLINRSEKGTKVPVSMVSCHVYSDGQATFRLGAALRQVVDQDARPTAVVAVSLLSGNYFTTSVAPGEDRVRAASDDTWNQRILGLMEGGKHRDIAGLTAEYAQATKADMGLKAHAFLRGILQDDDARGRVRAYGAIHGAAGAVVSF